MHEMPLGSGFGIPFHVCVYLGVIVFSVYLLISMLIYSPTEKFSVLDSKPNFSV
jgi:hypothetical protein